MGASPNTDLVIDALLTAFKPPPARPAPCPSLGSRLRRDLAGPRRQARLGGLTPIEYETIISESVALAA
jgi:hypothetical protein